MEATGWSLLPEWDFLWAESDGEIVRRCLVSPGPTPLLSPQNCLRATAGPCCLHCSGVALWHCEQRMPPRSFCLRASPLLADPSYSIIKTRRATFCLRNRGEQPPLSGCLLPCLHQFKRTAETRWQSNTKSPRGEEAPACKGPHTDRDRAGAGALPWGGTAAERGWSSIRMLLATDTGLESIIQESLWSAAFLATADGPPFKEGFEASSAWGDFKPHSHISGKYPHLSLACRSL